MPWDLWLVLAVCSVGIVSGCAHTVACVAVARLACELVMIIREEVQTWRSRDQG